MTSLPSHNIRAAYTDTTIRVYQAYNDNIADNVLKSQRFTSPWKPGRMTWIKPSAVWMGYRSGWTSKDVNQSRILAIDLNRTAFDYLYKNAVLARESKQSSIIIQWDPERELGGEADQSFTRPVDCVRSLQMGLRSPVTEWMTDNAYDPYQLGIPLINTITDVTELFAMIGNLLSQNRIDEANELIPEEKIYTVS